MDVTERDALALADPATLRRNGYGVADDEADCTRPGAAWKARTEAQNALQRQRAALATMRHLTRDDVRALLTAIAGGENGQ